MRQLRLLFGSVVFLAAFLLFLVEPIVAKQLLPAFGGSSSVWITCLVFFQTALLLAYLYAHWLTSQPADAVRFRKIHFALIVTIGVVSIGWGLLAAGPFAQRLASLMQASNPVPTIFAVLSVSIGLPFLLLGATSPLLQVWLADATVTGIVPYRLYALSNLGSLLALGLYPTLIEPHLTLKNQWLGWTSGFVLFCFLSLILVRKTWVHMQLSRDQILRSQVSPGQILPSPVSPSPGEEHELAPAPTHLTRKLLWIALPMAASMQLSAITSHLTQNVAAIPLLWVLPLAVYLLTLIVAFQLPRLLPRWLISRLLLVLLAALGYMLSQVEGSWPLKLTIGFFLIELFISGLFCHSEAYQLRPEGKSETTLFYLLFAAGGAIGSFFIGVACPLLFDYNYDLALSFFFTAALALIVLWPAGWGQRALWTTASALMLLLIFFLHIAYHRDTQVAVRNSYGSLRVKQTISYPPAILRTLSNGTIQHGSQIFSTELMRTPTTYYAPDSGVGIALNNCCQNFQPVGPRKIGVIGLGVGTIAAYGERGDQITFFEINPAVIPIAREVFAYIRNSPAKVEIVKGDARASLAHIENQQFDVLVVDAFSGDAIPLHLLTREAIALYQQHLAPGGILAFHISNQHVDLEPEIALLAQSAGMQTMVFQSLLNEERGEFTATWMLATQDRAFFQKTEVASHARPAHLDPRVRLWTDDYSSLLPVLHW